MGTQRYLRKTIMVRARDQEGSVLVISLLILSLLTLIGVAATTSAQLELQIAGNETCRKLAFYSAEASRGYVAGSPELWGVNNITVGAGVSFPDSADSSQTYALCPSQSFKGNVEYEGSIVPPRGSGYQVGTFRAHRYKMTCFGYGPAGAICHVDAGFYRIGF